MAISGKETAHIGCICDRLICWKNQVLLVRKHLETRKRCHRDHEIWECLVQLERIRGEPVWTWSNHDWWNYVILILVHNRYCLKWKKWKLCHHGERKDPAQELASSESFIFSCFLTRGGKIVRSGNRLAMVKSKMSVFLKQVVWAFFNMFSVHLAFILQALLYTDKW